MATQNNIIFTPKDDYVIARNLYIIYDIFNNHGKINEPTVSKNITDLLTKLQKPLLPIIEKKYNFKILRSTSIHIMLTTPSKSTTYKNTVCFFI